MQNNKKTKINNQSGAAMLISVIFFLFISLAIIAGLVSPSVLGFNVASADLKSKQSYFLAESGSEDAFYRISKSKTIGTSETITLGSNSVITTITTLPGNDKQVTSIGNVSNYKRKSSLLLKTGDGVVFKYGTQAGQGGFVFENNAYVTGSIYSNGPIVGSNNAYVTGDAFAAGATGTISTMCIGGVKENGVCSGSPTGDANAHTITNSQVTGTIYCQHGSSNNKACDTSRADPVEQDMPIPDSDIAQWKLDATNGGITNNSVTISTPTTIGPRKIVGDLTINKTLTIANTIYVTGNVIINAVSSLPSIKLNSSYGATSGMIIADGYIMLNNNVILQDSGTTGSYILLLSESNCDAEVGNCSGKDAIDVNNNSNISIVNAQKGTVSFSNNASVKEAVGKKVKLKNNVHISYGTGIIDINFTSGPSGAWTIGSWGEAQ